MARKVVWLSPARHDLDEAIGYVAQHSPQNALMLLDAFEDLAQSLLLWPGQGHVVSEWPHNDLREIPRHGFRLIYRVNPRQIEIVGLIHGSRLLPRHILQR